ncbi:MAG: valine--tRNA ligase [Bacteroidia bacterium]|nr:valine--tRNA ligase [Bacteroidia bacterium]
MSLSTTYNPAQIEEKWYNHWEEKRYFHSEPDEREPYTILIPPPNVTGVLHMGHMLDNTIQDVLIRKARMEGKNACWVPGTDHASIATEAKVVRKLREQGIKKSDLTRDQFLGHAWEWTDKYGGIILQQLRRLGASCDWDRTGFTMDEARSKHVMKAFIDLYKKGVLYRDYRMVNWDPDALTVLSNEEVLYKDEQSHLYHVRYKIEDSEDEWITIATTRPETILGDTAIAVHPDDERYQHLQGKKALVPLINRSIPIIFDDYVDREFGTGALKITPAHDINDYEIGKKHELETIDILNEDGSISKEGILYIGEDRFKARKLINKDLESAGHLVEIEPYTHNVGRSERTNAIIEPKLSLQWYVDMSKLAKPALENVINDNVEFFPKNMKNSYRHWMENIRDWCISRQLWWGHRIPAYYLKINGEEQIFIAESIEEALTQAKKTTGNNNLTESDLVQDEDVLGTWFSSWLWPISLFNGMFDQKELDYYYPTSVLVTGWDIMFLWVARMIMAGYEWQGDKPFKAVYFHGMVRDKQRRKMSKSLGNSPDALKLLSDYGADGVRFGMLSCSPAGGDLLFDEKLTEQGRNFCNKLWNALRLINGFEVADKTQPAKNALAIEWIEHKTNELLEQIDQNFKQYRLSEALMATYNFVWGDFCSYFLEVIKPEYKDSIDRKTYEAVIQAFDKVCKILHPFMPFITEEIWHQLSDKKSDLIVSEYPKPDAYDKEVIKSVEIAQGIISKVREGRNKAGSKQRDLLDLYIQTSDSAKELLSIQAWKDTVVGMAYLGIFEKTEVEVPNTISFIVGTDKFYLDAKQEINVEEEKQRLKKDLEYAKGFLASVKKKLSNERFVNNAPEQVVANERKKLADGQERLKAIEDSLASLN